MIGSFKHSCSLILAAGLLSACATIGDEDHTRSAFSSGPATLNNQQIGDIGSAIGSVTYRSGTNSTGAGAFADLFLIDTDLTPGSGTATYYSSYEIVGIENINFTETSATTGFITGSNFSDSGNITLSANFAAGTLTGADGDLSVNGTHSAGSTNLGGSVTYRGVKGSLDGALDVDSLIAAFHGNTDAIVFAGGLSGSTGP